MLTLRIINEKQNVKNYNGPSNWGEVTAKQLRIWAKICLLRTKISDALKAVSFIFFGIKESHFILLSEDQHHKIHDRLKFLLKNTCHKWVIESFRFLLGKYYGPANKLSNLTISEFRLTELYYQMYIKSNEPAYLHLLIAVLYRPKRSGVIDNDIRADFTEYAINRRAKRFKWLPASLKYAILFNYEGCRFFIIDHQKYKKLFKGGAKGTKVAIYDYDDMITSLAGGPFGNYIDTGRTNLYTFFDHIIKQNNDIKNLNP